jgi:predicted dehydrogenase
MIWLIGSGSMSIEYAKVLDALNRKFITIGRGDVSAEKFREATEHTVETGGLEAWLAKDPELPESVIVSVGVESLANVCIQLIKREVKHILLEKPGGVNRKEISMVHETAESFGAEVYIAYNRRFYPSVIKARELIEEDGGVLSFNFEFTELVRKIEKMIKAPGIKKHWFLGNSSHVVDLAFHLGGNPKTISTYHQGCLDWHPSAAIFAGSGVAKTEAIFSYKANWGSPGRWGIELLTKSRRLILQPLEKLRVQVQDSFDCKTVVIDDSHEKSFKPGLYKMVEEFLNKNSLTLKSLEEQTKAVNYYYQMANYQ